MITLIIIVCHLSNCYHIYVSLIYSRLMYDTLIYWGHSRVTDLTTITVNKNHLIYSHLIYTALKMVTSSKISVRKIPKLLHLHLHTHFHGCLRHIRPTLHPLLASPFLEPLLVASKDINRRQWLCPFVEDSCQQSITFSSLYYRALLGNTSGLRLLPILNVQILHQLPP